MGILARSTGTALNAQQTPLDVPRITARAGTKHVSRDTHLRSVHEVSGYHVKATDGEIRHVEDFLFDDETWEIRYVIVDTRNWWPAKKVLLRPQWIKKVSWATREFRTTMGREMIEKSPAWDPDSPVSREYDLHLHQHYGYAPYWTVDIPPTVWGPTSMLHLRRINRASGLRRWPDRYGSEGRALRDASYGSARHWAKQLGLSNKPRSCEKP